MLNEEFKANVKSWKFFKLQFLEYFSEIRTVFEDFEKGAR